jgi:hypothetical protein
MFALQVPVEGMTMNSPFIMGILKAYSYMLCFVTVKRNIMHGFLEKQMEIQHRRSK